MNSTSVAVLGAGMVGVSCAQALLARGFDVTLIDAQAPGEATSSGNAGVFATSSVIVFNHPQLWSSLPRLLTNQTPQFRYSPLWLMRQAPWLMRFLSHAQDKHFWETAQALHELIGLSLSTHQAWMKAAHITHRLRSEGWLLLHRQPATANATAWAQSVFQRLGVTYECLTAGEITDLEPALKPIFSHGLWLKDSASVDDPSAVVKAYAQQFVQNGGQLIERPVQGLRRDLSHWRVELGHHAPLQTQHVVVAMGPWSASFLSSQLGLAVPMVYERGYHQHYAMASSVPLKRPFHDAQGGYVLSPMGDQVRLTSGVEFTPRDAPAQTAQLEQAEANARQSIALGQPLKPQAWLGSRPTLPDSRPVIGPSGRHPGLWLAFGHQHIGLSTGAGTGELLADLLSQQPARINPLPFAAHRFGL